MTDFNDQILTAADSIAKIYSDTIDIMIVAGSGLSESLYQFLNAELSDPTIIEQAQIQGMLPNTVQSHTGRMLIGKFANKNIALSMGRHHLYEGYSAKQACLLVYALQKLGATRLIISNAAGALNANFRPGEIMVIDDHINLTGHNPLVGQENSLANRFVDMSQAYNPALADRACEAAAQLSIESPEAINSHKTTQFHRGIYAGVLGPSLETSAERRMMRLLGADAVGMSTVMEVIAARHCSMQVLGLSAITNLALGDSNQQVDTIDDVLRYAHIAGQKMAKIIGTLLQDD